MRSMILRCLVGLACVVAAEPALAGGKKAKASEKAASETVTRDESSEGNRKRLKASVLAEMGFVEFPQFGYGARGVFVQSPRLSYELGYAQSKFEFLGLSYESRIMSARGKWFPGNSFYIGGGLTHRSLEAKLDNIFTSQRETSFSRDSLMADLAIGNQWQFSGFTLGCDWAGVLVPVATLSEDKGGVSGTRTVGANLADASDEKNLDEFKKNADATRLQLVRFYLGWSF